MMNKVVSLAAAGLLFAGSSFADDAAIEAKIESLKRQMESQASQLQKLEAQAAPGQAAAPSDTTFGGYGEIAYNAYSKDGSRNQADLKRFVLFVGHRFSDRWSFNSEVEWEHAVTSRDDRGESEIEQAYLNYQVASNLNLKTGLFLMPFGFLNESHEPPVFYGVERNEVETRIIPSTWREGGVGLNGNAFGFAGDLGVVTGFDVAKFDDQGFPLASVHQELQFAKTKDLAFYGALNYRGIPGVTVGGSFFSGNGMQGNADFKAEPTGPDFTDINGLVTLWDAHARWQQSGLDLQALYARGKIGEAGKIDRTLDAFNTANPGADRPLVPDQFNGWLVQAAYTVWKRGEMSVTPFVRYERFDTQARMPEGFTADPVNKDKVTTYGLSFKPLSQIVFKIDRQTFKDNDANDRTNVGMGYMF